MTTLAPLPSPLPLPRLALLGAVFWLVAALLVRFLGPSVFVPGSALLLLAFVLGIPVAGAFTLTARWLSGTQGQRFLLAAVIMTSVALMLDGVALAFFPALYGPTHALGGAWIMWGAGLGQIIAFAQTRRAR